MRKGFTLLELLITITIMMVIAGAVIVSLVSRNASQDLTSSTQQIMAALRQAQSNAMAGEQGVAWGVHFENSTTTLPFYALFKSSYGSSSNIISYTRLPQTVGYSSGTLASGASFNVTFSPLSGTPPTATSVILYLLAKPSITSKIAISSTGVIGGFDEGFNFRNTAAFTTDGTNEISVNSSSWSYPQTAKDGILYGWTQACVATFILQDRNALEDRRLAGVNGVAVGNAGCKFEVDLPSPGNYQVEVAMGDAGSIEFDQGWKIEDGPTTLDTVSVGTLAQDAFADATGVVLSSTTWPSLNARKTYTFNTTKFYLELYNISGVPITLAHLRILN